MDAKDLDLYSVSLVYTSCGIMDRTTSLYTRVLRAQSEEEALGICIKASEKETMNLHLHAVINITK